MDRIKEVFATVTTWVNEHRKVSLVIACVLAGFVWGAWSRGLFAAPLPCDLTGSTLTCTIPASGTTPPPTGGGTTPPPQSEYSGCPANALKWASLYPRAVANQDTTSALGPLTTGSVLTIKMKVPATASGFKSAYFSGVYGGSRQLTWAVSEKACDFDTPVVDLANTTAKKTAYLKGISSQNISFRYEYGAGKTLEPGKTYYLNIRIDSCNAADCPFGGITLP